MPSACNKASISFARSDSSKEPIGFSDRPEVNGNDPAVGRQPRDHPSPAFAAAPQLVQEQDRDSPASGFREEQAEAAGIDVGHQASVSSARGSVCQKRL